MKKDSIIYTILSVAAFLLIAMTLTACSKKAGQTDSYSDDLMSDMDAFDDIDTDIDLDSLDKSVDNIKNLDFDMDDLSDHDTDDADDDNDDDPVDSDDDDDPDYENDDEDDFASDHEGDKTGYSYTDVIRSGNDITVIPNGGMNASTVLYAGKDLEGFLDYVDSDVLEAGRTINRDFFYDLLAIMLVDSELSSDIDDIEKSMMMALAVANDFHNMDVRVNDCYLDADNAAEYRYHVTAYGKDDTWIVNYGKRTFYMNDGGTEYSSDMFKDEYLAVWLVAIEEYYGIK